MVIPLQGILYLPFLLNYFCFLFLFLFIFLVQAWGKCPVQVTKDKFLPSVARSGLDQIKHFGSCSSICIISWNLGDFVNRNINPFVMRGRNYYQQTSDDSFQVKHSMWNIMMIMICVNKNIWDCRRSLRFQKKIRKRSYCQFLAD